MPLSTAVWTYTEYRDERLMDCIVRIQHEAASAEAEVPGLCKESADHLFDIVDGKGLERGDLRAVDHHLEIDVIKEADLRQQEQISVRLGPEQTSLTVMKHPERLMRPHG